MNCFLKRLRFVLGWRPKRLRWCPSSSQAIEEAECKIFSHLKRPYKLRFVKIPSWEKGGEMLDIHTLSMSTENSNSTPLVMVHGYGSGIGLFVLNLDSLSENRPVYAFDVLGFGRSSRPFFSKDSVEVEKQMTESIEHWRKQIGLERFFLFGHSFGGYLASSYASQHPERIKHLILADPWGIGTTNEKMKQFALSFHGRMIFAITKSIYPMGMLRIVGPLGLRLVRKLRPELIGMFSPIGEDADVILNYIYHVNAQTPSGEKAFTAMTIGYGIVKESVLPRLINLPNKVPITFIYGSKSWFDPRIGILVKKARKDSFVAVKLIDGASHNLYADRPEAFNFLVNSICNSTDADPDKHIKLH